MFQCVKSFVVFLFIVLTVEASSTDAPSPIIHDAEHKILWSQHGKAWTTDDKLISDKLNINRQNNGGKRPNIIYILLDDLGFGEIGMPALDVVRGYSTPNINSFAEQGMSFNRMYAEAVCTPTRAAMSTGRLAIRTGTYEAKTGIVGEGLNKNEKTIAEVLSESGYSTVHIGKWHLSDIEQGFPHNQGFDYAEFPVHQQAQMSLMTVEGQQEGLVSALGPNSRLDSFELDKTFRTQPSHMAFGMIARKGEKAREVNFKSGEVWTQNHYRKIEEGYRDSVLTQLDHLSKSEKPFFLQYWPQFPLSLTRAGIKGGPRTLNGGPIAEGIAEVDEWLGIIFKRIDDLGIADNTLVVIMGDNGPFMQFMKGSGQSDRIYRGGKGSYLEGGVRVNGFARWPSMIEAGAKVQDIVHVTDLYTTFARVAEATQSIPRDRIIDGVDQTPLMLLGQTKGRRDYVYIYQGQLLKAVVKQQFKLHVPSPGQTAVLASVFDLYKDPREERPQHSIQYGPWVAAPFIQMVKRHMIMKMRFPNNKTGRGIPYSGIENLRPETQILVDRFKKMNMPPKKSLKK